MIHVLTFLLLVQSPTSNTELGYRMTVPAGFTPFPDGRSQPDIVDCWTEAEPASANGGLALCVHRLRGVLPREPLRQSDLPAGTELETFTWRSFEIQGLRSQPRRGGLPLAIHVVQVPLRREAVQLVIAGPADQNERSVRLMQATLDSFEGETNWLSSAERTGRLGTIAGWWIGIGVAVVLVLIWRRRRAARAAGA
jgi:hypothetical protein